MLRTHAQRLLPTSPPVLSHLRAAAQTELTINRPGDAYEQEADRAAEQVLRTPKPLGVAPLSSSPVAVRRSCQCGGTCSACQAGTHDEHQPAAVLQAKGTGAASARTAVAPPIVHRTLGSRGQPLDAASRAYFEPRFGHDFSSIQVHSDARAASSARAVNARAYTVGQHLVFGAGQYAPGTTEGRRLLAHELAHAVQQSGSALSRKTLQRQPVEEARDEIETEEETLHEVVPVPNAQWRRTSPVPLGWSRPPPVVRAPTNPPAPTGPTQAGPTGSTQAPEPTVEVDAEPSWAPSRDPDVLYLYSDQGAGTNWSKGAAFRGKQVQVAHLRYDLESVPQAVLGAGGSAPDFVTVSSEQAHRMTAAEAFIYDELDKKSPITYRPRLFHLSDAVAHDLGLATTLDEEYGIVLSYLPELLPGRLNMVPPSLPAPAGWWLPATYRIKDTVVHPRLPRGAAIGRVNPDLTSVPVADRFQLVWDVIDAARARREAAVRAAEQKAANAREAARVATLAEAEEFALKGRRRREGRCTNERTAPRNPSPDHDAYAAYVAERNGYARIRGPNTELTWKTPEGVKYEFDTFNPQLKTEVWEVKTKHEWTSLLGVGAAPAYLDFHERIVKLERQRLRGLYVANRCGLNYRYAVETFQAQWGLSDAWKGLPPIIYVARPESEKK